MGVTDEAIHLRLVDGEPAAVHAALLSCLPTAKWDVGTPDGSATLNLLLFGPSPGGWWHLVPESSQVVGLGGDRTVMRRLAKRLGAPVLSAVVLDSDVALLSCSSTGGFETLASGDWHGRRVGRARATASVWGPTVASDDEVQRIGKLLRGANDPVDGLVDALEFIGVDEARGWGHWREANLPIGSVTLRQVVRPVPETRPFQIFLSGAAELDGVSCIEGGSVTGFLRMQCEGTQPGAVEVRLSGPAVDSGLVVAVSGRIVDRGRASPAVTAGSSINFGELTPPINAEIRFRVSASAPVASWFAAVGVDETSGAAGSAVIPVAVRARCSNGSTRSVRNDWLTMRLRPGTDDAIVWHLITSWLGDHAVAPASDHLFDVMLVRPRHKTLLRRMRVADIGSSRRWNRIGDELGGLESVTGVPNVHAFIPREGGFGFEYWRGDRGTGVSDPMVPRLELRIDRAFARDVGAVDRILADTALAVDELVRAGHVLQAVMGRSESSSADSYLRKGWISIAERAGLDWSTTYIWSLGSTVWLGRELSARLASVGDLSSVADVVHLGEGCRIENHDGYDITRLKAVLSGLYGR